MAETLKPKTNITQEHLDDFNAIASGKYANIALFSCFCNGEPTAAIVAINPEPGQTEGLVNIKPMFVAVTPGMKLVDHDGQAPVRRDGLQPKTESLQ